MRAITGRGGLGTSTIGGVMASFPAAEALSFSDTFCAFSGGELGEGDVIYVHGIGVLLGARGEEGHLRSSLF